MLGVKSIFEWLAQRKYLADLPDEWVEGIAEADFTDIGVDDDLPQKWADEYDANQIFEELEEWSQPIQKVLWQRARDTSAVDGIMPAKVFMEIMREQGLEADNLLAFLVFHVKKGQRGSSNMLERRHGLLCQRIGLVLITLPGTFTFELFSPGFFSTCISLQPLTSKLDLKRGSGGGGVMRRKSRKSSGHSELDLDISGDFGDNFSASETEDIIDQMVEFQRALFVCLQLCPLTESPESLLICMENLVSLLSLEQPTSYPCSQKLSRLTKQAGANLILLVEKNSVKTNSLWLTYLFMNYHRALAQLIDIQANSDSSGSTRAQRETGVVVDRLLSVLQEILVDVKEAADEHLVILVSKLATHSLERANARKETLRCCQGVALLSTKSVFQEMVRFFCDMCESKSNNQRLFGVKMLGEILLNKLVDRKGYLQVDTESAVEEETVQSKEGSGSSEAVADEPNEEVAEGSPPPPTKQKKEPLITGAKLLSLLFSCGEDVSPPVRKEVLNVLGECVASKNHGIILLFDEVLHTSRRRGCANEAGSDEFVTWMLMKTVDSRVHVRKAAYQIIIGLMTADVSYVIPRFEQVLKAGCTEESVLIRKSIARDVTKLLTMYPDNDSLLTLFVRDVIPMCNDPETSVQETVITLINEMLFERLQPQTSQSALSPSGMLPWLVLAKARITDVENALTRAISLMVDVRRQDRKLMETMERNLPVIESYLDSPAYEPEAWMIYSMVIEHLQAPSPGLVVQKYLSTLHDSNRFVFLRAQRCLNSCLSLVSARDRVHLIEFLKTEIPNYALEADAIESAITAFWVWMTPGEFRSWLNSVYESTSNDIRLVAELANDEDSVVRLERMIFTFGCVVAHMESEPSEFVILILTTLATSGLAENADDVALERCQVISLTALGKMMLQHQSVAESMTPYLARILEKEAKCPLNVKMVGLCIYRDTCVRYGSLVDELLGSVVQLLQAESAKLRALCLEVLVYLLARDHIKMRSRLFLRLLSATLDRDPHNHNLAKFVMVYRLNKTSKKNLFAQYFIPAMFFFNGVQHPEFNKPEKDENDHHLFALLGSKKRRKRKALYRLLLAHVTDADRLQLTVDLCHRVLNRSVDHVVKVDKDTYYLFEDVFKVLGSDAIRIQYLKQSNDGAAGEDDDDVAAEESNRGGGCTLAVYENRKKSILASFNVATVVDYVLPKVLEFKGDLKGRNEGSRIHDSLRSYISAYLMELSRQYKTDWKRFLDTHQYLQAEVSEDIARHSQETQEGVTLDLMVGQPEMEGEEDETSVDTAEQEESTSLMIDSSRNVSAKEKEMARDAVKMLEGYKVVLEELEGVATPVTPMFAESDESQGKMNISSRDSVPVQAVSDDVHNSNP